MISGQLIHLIEQHTPQIMARVVSRIHNDPHMPHTKAQLESELRDRGLILLENLGHWLSAGREQEIGRVYVEIGRRRFEQDVPLHECVRALFLIREVVMDFVEEHVVSKTSLELYAEEELDRRLSRFFDLLTIHLVQGYETAIRKSAAAHA
jgi:hypothetical protein